MSHSDLAEACLETIRRRRMVERGDRVVVGVSGGADSVALLNALHRLASQGTLEIIVTAVHLNHCLRGAESDRDEAFVRALCSRLGIPLVAESAAVAELARKNGRTVEEEARECRYTLFQRVCGDSGKIATAHTLDDSAETMLLNLTRGTGLKGLCGIPAVRGNIIRPLIDCTREQVEEYCRENQLEYVTDSTNLEDSYTRNKLRHRVIPVLREINPAFLDKAADTMEVLREENNLLERIAGDALASIRQGECRFAAAPLLELEKPIRMRAFLALLRERDIAPDRRQLEQLDRLAIAGDGRRVQVSARWYVCCDGEALEFSPRVAEEPIAVSPVPISLGMPFAETSVAVFSDKKLCIRCLDYRDYEEKSKIHENQFKNLLDCDKMSKIVILRVRLPGDRIRLRGRNGTKTLKKLYNEERIPVDQRARRLVVAEEDGGVLWVEGLGAAEHVSVDEGTSRVLELTVEE